MTRHQRAAGALHVGFQLRDGATALARLRQSGCLKARFPRVGAREWPVGVVLNTSGGVTGGDRLEAVVRLAEGTRATFTTVAAERCYRAVETEPAARVSTRVEVAAGACAEWLPQETILFDGCALDRSLEVALAPEGWFLGAEMLVFGRTAMGEVLRRGHVRDRVTVRRGGRLMLQDAVRLSGDLERALSRGATAKGALGVGVVWCVGLGAESRLEALRAGLEGRPAEWGASAWEGMLVARFLAADGARLRASVLAGLQALRDGRPMPRPWFV